MITDFFVSPRPGYSHSEQYRVENSVAFKAFDGIQVTESESHPGWRRSSKRGTSRGDIGGEFFTKKRYMLGGNPSGIAFSGWLPPEFDGSRNGSTYSGPFLPWSPDQMSYPPFANSDDSVLASWGTKAISLASPVNPTANVTTFVGEFLQDGIPHLLGHAFRALRDVNPKSIAKAIGEEHLNVEFGWLPFVSDIRNMLSGIRHADSILKQLDRDSGRAVRRGWKFKPETTTTISMIPNIPGPWTLGGSSIPFSQQLRPKTQIAIEDKVVRTRWFSGAFTYYIPPAGPNGFTSDQVARRILQAEKVLGVTPTPDAVWNLLPWSWLTDWVLNTGSLLGNLRNWILFNQVLLYGYMMEHTVSTRTYTLVGTYYLRDGSPGPMPPSVVMVSETKRRIKATPYGFGVTYSGLSGVQKSIIAALGLTHGLK